VEVGHRAIRPYDMLNPSKSPNQWPVPQIQPIFRLWLGVTEYLFRKPALLDEVIRIAIEDHSFRSDDLEFTFAARGWSECVSFGDFASYKDRFEKIQEYFSPRFPEASRVGNDMIRAILESQLGEQK